MRETLVQQPNVTATPCFCSNSRAFSANSGQSETVTTLNYGGTFATTPKVLITQFDASTNSYVFKVNTRGLSSFQVGWRKPDNSAFGADADTTITWLAIGT